MLMGLLVSNSASGYKPWQALPLAVLDNSTHI